MTSKAVERRRDIVTALLLIVIVTIAFSDVLFGSARFFYRDISRFYYPTGSMIRSLVKSGDFPWWNPYYSAGQPIAANPEFEVFYPPSWLMLLPSYDLGFRLHILIHFYIALLGAFAFLRSLRVGRAGASFGALSLSLGGCFLSLVNLLPILFCAAWMPLIFLFVRRLLVRPNRRDFAFAALFAGIQTLAGEPTTLVQTWLLIGAWALWRAVRRPDRARRLARSAVILALLLGAAVAVGSVQMIPAVDHARDSVRSRGLPHEALVKWSMHPARLAELVMPEIFGRVAYRGVRMYWGRNLYHGGDPFLFSIYFGLLGIVLVPAAFARRRAGGGFLAVIVIASFLLAFGRHTPLYDWLIHAGITTSVRYPEKWSLMGIVVLTLASGIAFDRCVRGDMKTIRRALVAALVVAGATLAAAVFALTPGYGTSFARLFDVETRSRWGRMALGLSRVVLIIAFLRATAATVILDLRRRLGSPRLWSLIAIGFTFIDLAWLGFHLSPRISKTFYETAPATETLARPIDQYRIFPYEDWNFLRSRGAAEYYRTGLSSYWIYRNGMYPMVNERWGFRTVLQLDYDRTLLQSTSDLVDAMWKMDAMGKKDVFETLMNMSNAWYRTEYRPIREELARVGGDVRKAIPWNFVRETSAPRYYFADEVVSCRGVDEFVRDLTTRKYPPRVAFVDMPAFQPARGSVTRVDERPSRITIDADAAGKSFLVISVTPHKYWTATVDGREAPLRITNVGYQGLLLGAGRHHIVMQYRNTLIPPMACLSLLAAIAFLAMAILGRRREEYNRAS